MMTKVIHPSLFTDSPGWPRRAVQWAAAQTASTGRRPRRRRPMQQPALATGRAADAERASASRHWAGGAASRTPAAARAAPRLPPGTLAGKHHIWCDDQQPMLHCWSKIDDQEARTAGELERHNASTASPGAHGRAYIAMPRMWSYPGAWCSGMLRRTGTCVCNQQHERRQRQSGQPKVVLLLQADAIGVTAPLWYLAGR